MIVSDRLHVIRVVLGHFLEGWKSLDPVGRQNRGLLSLMRRKSANLSPEQQERLGRYLDEHPAVLNWEQKEGKVVFRQQDTAMRLAELRSMNKMTVMEELKKKPKIR